MRPRGSTASLASEAVPSAAWAPAPKESWNRGTLTENTLQRIGEFVQKSKDLRVLVT